MDPLKSPIVFASGDQVLGELSRLALALARVAHSTTARIDVPIQAWP